MSDVPLYNHVRIEKAAYTAKRADWETYFAGPCLGDYYALGESMFETSFPVPWSKWARLGIPLCYNWVKRRLKKVIEMLKPDIIHAYNIFSAEMIHDLGYPFVFEDAEFYSSKKISDIEWGQSSLVGKATASYEAWKWRKWEDNVAEKAPVITVSDSIAEVYAKRGAKTFVVPNYPLLFELSKIRLKDKSDVFTVAYVGNDISKVLRSYRDTSGVIELIKDVNLPFVVVGDDKLASKGLINSQGFVPHLKLYEVLSSCHVGIIPWGKHWLHRYLNPNKPYLYAHSGLVVVVPSSLTEVVKALKGNCKTIDQLSDLKNLLRELSSNTEVTIEEGRKTKEYAQKNLVWEYYEERIREAYKTA